MKPETKENKEARESTASPGSSEEPDGSTSYRSRLVKGLLLSCTAAAVLLTIVYAIRPDALAALTVFPAWAWIIAAAPMAVLVRRGQLRHALVCLSAWVVFCTIHVEEPRSVVRGVFRPAVREKSEGIIRLVSFNCGGGQVSALEEVMPLQPDVVFLQESPGREQVETLAQRLYGGDAGVVWDGDTSILLKGETEDLRADAQSPFYSHACANLPGLEEIELVSLRLWPNNPRMDLWNPTCWKTQAAVRRRQLEQMKCIVANLNASSLLAVAGDFNAPQGDRIFRLLPDAVYDTFAAEGRGIGNTITNDIPMLRIDQIWVSRGLETVQSFTIKSRSSDHRIVVSDVRLRKQ